MEQKKISAKRKIQKRKACLLCTDKIDVIDYKNIELLQRFTTERCKIVPNRNSGTCSKHQRKLTNAIKRARYIGLIPYCTG